MSSLSWQLTRARRACLRSCGQQSGNACAGFFQNKRSSDTTDAARDPGPQSRQPSKPIHGYTENPEYDDIRNSETRRRQGLNGVLPPKDAPRGYSPQPAPLLTELSQGRQNPRQGNSTRPARVEQHSTRAVSTAASAGPAGENVR